MKMKTAKNGKKMKPGYKDAIEIVGAFLVAFLFYQILILATGTQLPIVSVVSDSMYHTQTFDKWWQQSGPYYSGLRINESEFKEFQNYNGLSRGDLLLVVRPDNLQAGDIIIYQRNGNPFTIVHRIIEIQNDRIVTKGDNNVAADPQIQRSNVQGKVIFAVPILGYPRFLLHMIGI